MKKRMLLQWIIGVAAVAWVVCSDNKLEHLDHVFNIVGLFCLFCGIVGRLYSTLYIGGMKNSGSDGNSFVRDGIYTTCRNPLYFFSFVAFIGVLLLKGQLLFLFMGGGIFALIYYFTIKGEEKYLREKFGQSYEDFLQSTPRFFPNFRKFRYPQKFSIYPHFFHKEVRSAFVWVFVALFIYAVECFQDMGFIPVLYEVY